MNIDNLTTDELKKLSTKIQRKLKKIRDDEFNDKLDPILKELKQIKYTVELEVPVTITIEPTNDKCIIEQVCVHHVYGIEKLVDISFKFKNKFIQDQFGYNLTLDSIIKLFPNVKKHINNIEKLVEGI